MVDGARDVGELLDWKLDPLDLFALDHGAPPAATVSGSAGAMSPGNVEIHDDELVAAPPSSNGEGQHPGIGLTTRGA